MFQVPDYVPDSHIADEALEKVSSLAKFFKQKQEDNPYLEFEIRLGKKKRRKFEAGIEESLLQDLEESFEHYEGWTNITKAVYIDYFYEIGTKMLRTTTELTNPGEDNEALKNYTIEKLNLKKMILKVGDLDARVSVNSEKPVPDNDLQNSTFYSTTFVRIKERTSYFLANWKYDLTRTWSGKTFTEAEYNRSQQTPIFEIEIEIISPSYVQKHSHKYLALSSMLKLSALFDHRVPVN